MNAAQTRATLGLTKYLDNYGTPVPGENNVKGLHRHGVNLRGQAAQEELALWQLTVPFSTGDVTVLCNPEDRRCGACAVHPDGAGALCPNCEIPVCAECWGSLRKQQLPKFALANDLWTGYIPAMIYEQKVTYMELLCASVM